MKGRACYMFYVCNSPMAVCKKVNPSLLFFTLLPGGNATFASLTPSSWTAGGSRWTGGGTRVWWGTWAWSQRCSSSACPLPGAHRASPAIWTERSEGISAKKKQRFKKKKQQLLSQQQGGEKCHSLFLQNWSFYWGVWVPPSSSWTVHWSYTLWWSTKTCANTLLLLCLTSGNTHILTGCYGW